MNRCVGQCCGEGPLALAVGAGLQALGWAKQTGIPPPAPSGAQSIGARTRRSWAASAGERRDGLGDQVDTEHEE